MQTYAVLKRLLLIVLLLSGESVLASANRKDDILKRPFDPVAYTLLEVTVDYMNRYPSSFQMLRMSYHSPESAFENTNPFRFPTRGKICIIMQDTREAWRAWDADSLLVDVKKDVDKLKFTMSILQLEKDDAYSKAGLVRFDGVIEFLKAPGETLAVLENGLYRIINTIPKLEPPAMPAVE